MRDLDLKSIVASSRAEGIEKFLAGACAAYSGDKTMLASIRAGHRDRRIIRFCRRDFQRTIGSAGPPGRRPFFEVVRWTVFL
jgi:hypothetical protein